MLIIWYWATYMFCLRPTAKLSAKALKALFDTQPNFIENAFYDTLDDQ
jgi:hypothetical protein